MKFYKFVFAVVFAAVSLFVFSSVSNAENQIQIITTIFPEYDWVQNILGENPADIEVTQLLNTGVDLHSYQPIVDDILKISVCDIFIYVGGESDAWVENVLKNADNPKMTAINLMAVLGDAVKEEELVEGMESEEEEEDEDEIEYDEHVWLSLKNASILCRAIADAIALADPDHADIYLANVSAYIEKLESLDQAYQETVAAANVRTLVFADRFPFRYLMDDYGLEYYAAFSGCSAETEASFETVIFLANKVNELSLRSVLTIEGRNDRIAETVIRNTNTKDQQILTLDSMQSTTTKDAAAGKSYLSIMEKNLEVLKEALY